MRDYLPFITHGLGVGFFCVAIATVSFPLCAVGCAFEALTLAQIVRHI